MVYVYLVLQQIIASTTHIVGKVVVGRVDPILVVALRSSIAAIVLLVYVRMRHTWHVLKRQDYRRFFVLGLISVPVNQYAFLYGLKYTTPANAALLYALTPALVVLAQKLVLREQVRPRRLVAVAIAFVGVVVILLDKGVDLAPDYTFGNIIIFLAVIAWAAYTLMAKSFIVRYGAVESTALAMAAGALLTLPLLAAQPEAIGHSTLDLTGWLGILYLGGVTSTVGYALWYIALGKIPASRVAVFQNIQPVLTAVMSIVILGQGITPHFILGGIITLVGVLLTQLW